MAKLSVVYVDNAQSLDAAITGYIVKGYLVANRTPTSATLQKAKKFSILWALVGFFVMLIPFFIYVIWYATQPAVKVIELKVRPA